MIYKTIILLYLFLVFQDTWYSGKILSVTDGDTFVMQLKEVNIRVRLEGIDAPEKKQLFSQESKAFLEKYLHEECRLQKTGIDRFGRTLGVLWVNGVNINLLMVKEGYAWHFKKYSKDKSLEEAEADARKSKKGLWKELAPIAPWDWRKK
jgi:endonuclease YncB( thermonuclease family)